MIGLLGFLGFCATIVGLFWLILWADELDERRYQDWYDHPDRVWNQDGGDL